MPRPLLLTSFEPFDGQAVNASEAVVAAVARDWSGPAPLVTATLPVSFLRARRELRRLVAEHEPAVVLAVGEAGGRSAVGIERVALNLVDARIPDDDGSAPVDVPVVAGAPVAFLSTLPVKACLVAARRTGAPVELSGHAGTFVCNATFYALLHLLDRTPEVRGGFVHVPRLPEQVGPGEPSLAAEESARAVRAVLEAAAADEVPLAAGSEA